MDSSQIHIPYIIGAVAVLDLSTSPVKALDLDGLAVLNLATEWNVRVPSVLYWSARPPVSHNKHVREGTVDPWLAYPGQPSKLCELVRSEASRSLVEDNDCRRSKRGSLAGYIQPGTPLNARSKRLLS